MDAKGEGKLCFWINSYRLFLVRCFRSLQRTMRCEAFSAYPRIYVLIHANHLFSLYKNKCNADDILLDMDRILRLEGAVIIQDDVNTMIKVKRIISGMRWDSKVVDHEDSPLVNEKGLIAVRAVLGH